MTSSFVLLNALPPCLKNRGRIGREGGQGVAVSGPSDDE